QSHHNISRPRDIAQEGNFPEMIAVFQSGDGHPLPDDRHGTSYYDIELVTRFVLTNQAVIRVISFGDKELCDEVQLLRGNSSKKRQLGQSFPGYLRRKTVAGQDEPVLLVPHFLVDA